MAAGQGQSYTTSIGGGLNRHDMTLGAFSWPEQVLWSKPEARGGKPALSPGYRQDAEIGTVFCINLPQSDIVNTERERTPNVLSPDVLTYLTQDLFTIEGQCLSLEVISAGRDTQTPVRAHHCLSQALNTCQVIFQSSQLL